MISKEEALIKNATVDLINQFSVVLRTAQLHDAENVAVQSAVARLTTLINELFREEGRLTLELRGEYFYLNECRIRYSPEHLLNFDSLVKEFKTIKIGGIIISGKVSDEDIKSLMKAVTASVFSDNAYELLDEALVPLQTIAVIPPREIVEEDALDVRKMVKKTYFQAVAQTRAIIGSVKKNEKVNLRRAKRVVTTMVNHILDHEQLLLGMTAIKDYDEYTYHHSVNVSILSVALGNRLGFNRRQLVELGMVSLFHDMGKTNVPSEILNKPSSFTDEEWKIIRKHPLWGVRALFRMRDLDELTMKAAIVSFEHHMNFDFSGYPKVQDRHDLDLYSKIVTIADQYDAMTSSRVYARLPMSPEKALSTMLDRCGRHLDPLLFKFFANMVGIYPIGTLLMLDTRELALVYENNPVLPSRPRVVLITDSTGDRISGSVVELAEKDSADQFKRSIVNILDPNKYNINLAEYLL